MAAVGADLDDLIGLASAFEENSKRLEENVVWIDSRLSDVAWLGEDRDRFIGEWEGGLRSRMLHVASTLSGAAVLLRNQAREQEFASSAGSTPSLVGVGMAVAAAGAMAVAAATARQGGNVGVSSAASNGGANARGAVSRGVDAVLKAGSSRILEAKAEGFKGRYVGVGVDYDGHFQYQCVDLVNRYAHDLFGVSAYQQFDGLDYAFQMYDRAKPEFFTKVASSGPVQIGDIVCIDKSPANSAGHVAIVTGVGSDGALTVIEQDGSRHWEPAKVRTLSRQESNLIMGYLRPRVERLK